MKMSDVFDLPLVAKDDKLTDKKGLLIAYSCDAECLALAVNNYDSFAEVVEWVQSLDVQKAKEGAEEILKAIKGDSDE